MSLITNIKALVVFLHTNEPSLTVGTVTGAAAAITEWVQTNQITNVRTFAAFAAPVVLSYVIRHFVTSPAGVREAIVHDQLSRAAANKPAA